MPDHLCKCGADVAYIKGLCTSCYAYERRTGRPRPPKLVEQRRGMDIRWKNLENRLAKRARG